MRSGAASDLHGTLLVTSEQFSSDSELYTVTFDEYSAGHTKRRLRKFSTIEALEHFLNVEVGISAEAIKKLVSDLRNTSSAQIFDLELSREDLVRLGLE